MGVDVCGGGDHMIPVVSVNMPVYNAERYLPAAVESILGQTFTNFELIAIDDGSTDGSWDLLQKYSRQDSRMVVRTRPNLGIVKTRNEALGLSRGEFVAVLDADDLAMPERLERQVAYLRSHPECVAVGGRVMMIDPDGEPLCEWFFCDTHEEIERAHLSGRGGAMPHIVSTFRRSALLSIGGYRESFPVSHDYDLFLRIAEGGGRLTNLPLLLGKYRQHLQSVSYARHEQQKVAARTALREAQTRRGLRPEPTVATENGLGFRMLPTHRKWAWWARCRARKYRSQACLPGPSAQPILPALVAGAGLLSARLLRRRPWLSRIASRSAC